MEDWTLEEIAGVVENAYLAAGGTVLRCGCPAHGGSDPNCAISFSEETGKLLATCHSRGCDFEEIAAALRERLGQEPAEEAAQLLVGGRELSRPQDAQGPRVWEIRDADGTVVACHVRRDLPGGKKDVFWRLPDGRWGLKKAGLSPAALPLYGAEIAARLPVNVPVVVTEGEKAADALRDAGICGMGTVTGAGGTPDGRALSVLAGRTVVLWPDNDEDGFAHMGRVAEGLINVAAEVLWHEWPEAPEKGDAADYEAEAGKKPDLTTLLDSPRWSRPPAIEGRVLLGRAIENGIEPPVELLPDLLLAGKAHNVYSPGGVGKTWVLIWMAAELVKAGKKVVVFDLENGARTYAERFEEMGVEPEALDNFALYYPFPVFDAASYGKLLDEEEPDAVMFDSWIGFLAADGKDENEAAGISAWAEDFVKPALRRGAAVVTLDHVGHEHDARERGSRRKRDEMDVVWRLASLEEFGREHAGSLVMTLQKDREGWLPGRLSFRIGTDPSEGRFVMHRDDTRFAAQERDLATQALNDREEAALSALTGHPEGLLGGEWHREVQERSEGAGMSRRALYRVKDSLLKKGRIEEAESETSFGGKPNVRYVVRYVPAPHSAQPAQPAQQDVGPPGVVRIERGAYRPPPPNSAQPPSVEPGAGAHNETEAHNPHNPEDLEGFAQTRAERERRYEEMKAKLRDKRRGKDG